MKWLAVSMALICCGKIFAQENNFRQTELFSRIREYPVIKDEKAFIKALKENVHFWDSPHRQMEKINYFKKIKLFGSNDFFYLLEFEYEGSSSSGYPWKDQFLFTGNGKLVGSTHLLRVDVVTVFPGQNPFLFALAATVHGNGGHYVYRIKNGKMVNVYGAFSTTRPQTYASGGDIDVNHPFELHHRFTDENKDGFNDIVFYGKMSYSGIALPDATIPVEYIFLYHPETGHFTQKEDYSKKYGYIFGTGYPETKR